MSQVKELSKILLEYMIQCRNTEHNRNTCIYSFYDYGNLSYHPSHFRLNKSIMYCMLQDSRFKRHRIIQTSNIYISNEQYEKSFVTWGVGCLGEVCMLFEQHEVRFTKDYPIFIKINSNFLLCSNSNHKKWSLQNFVHATTAMVSWHVQNFVVILCSAFYS